MHSSAIFFVSCLVIACAAAVPAPQPENQQPAYHAPVNAQAEPARNKRFFPIAAYSAPISTVSGYSYLAPYANSGKIVHYPAPVVSSYAAVPAISTYSAFPAYSAYAAAPFAAYHAF